MAAIENVPIYTFRGVVHIDVPHERVAR